MSAHLPAGADTRDAPFNAPDMPTVCDCCGEPFSSDDDRHEVPSGDGWSDYLCTGCMGDDEPCRGCGRICERHSATGMCADCEAGYLEDRADMEKDDRRTR